MRCPICFHRASLIRSRQTRLALSPNRFPVGPPSKLFRSRAGPSEDIEGVDHDSLDRVLRAAARAFAGAYSEAVYERRRDLPRVGIAALAAEAYLPFAGRRTE